MDHGNSAVQAAVLDSGPAIRPHFCPAGVDPHTLHEWTTRTAEIRDKAGKVVFRQTGVRFPARFSQQAVNIVANKYFYGDVDSGLDPAAGGRESGIDQVVDRIGDAFAAWGVADGHFADGAAADVFGRELKAIMLGQYALFNSPVEFNVGLWHKYGVAGSTRSWHWEQTTGTIVAVASGESYKHPQGSACFILGVRDDMEAILDRAQQEGMLFKHGSGAGSDNSALRSTHEKLSGGGRPSGPVSFMRIYDAVGAVVTSGGRTRRAAKMETLKCWHPDIEDFILRKQRSEDMIRTLVRGGYDPDFNAQATRETAYQNANHSVRVTAAFLRKWSGDDPDDTWQTIAVTTGTAIGNNGKRMPQHSAKRLGRLIAEGTWDCGDPGVQYEDNIQKWHTCIRRGGRLLTTNGWIAVETLAELGNDAPAIFDGIGYTKAKVWKTGRKPVVRLHTSAGQTIDTTADHLVYTGDGWTKAADCVDKFVPRLLPAAVTGGEVDLPRAITGASGRFYNHAATDVMESIGFLQGDGGTDGRQRTAVYYTEAKDSDFIQETVLPILSDIAADKGEVDYVPTVVDGGFVFVRQKLAAWLSAIGCDPRPLPQRTLPTFVWSLSRGLKCDFLRGLFGANGSITTSRGEVLLVATSRAMLQEVQLLLQQLGIQASVRTHNKAKVIRWNNGDYESKESYRLEITHPIDVIDFARTIGFPQACQRTKLAGVVTTLTAAQGNAGSGVKQRYRSAATVIRVDDLGVEDDVYDFNSPITAMGLVNGVLVHNCPNTAAINSSNPCSEYHFLDDSACNLASINLLRFRRDDGSFDSAGFRQAVRVMLTAQEILVDHASYPSEKIALNSHRFRPLGLGHTNVGSLLMADGLAYDSAAGRALCGVITAILQGQAAVRSAEMARDMGPFDGFAENREPMLRVMRQHEAALDDIDAAALGERHTGLLREAYDLWAEAISLGERHGYRNAQFSVLAPCGTIAFWMDSDTTGIEPDIALVKYKHLDGGGVLRMVNPNVPQALSSLGYKTRAEHSAGLPTRVRAWPIEDIVAWIEKYDTIEGCPGLVPEDLPVFDCAFPPDKAQKKLAADGIAIAGRTIAPDGHMKMMAAAQPFISGAISKTVNMPKDATVDEIERAYLRGGELGLKALAIYRDGSKEAQPVTTSNGKEDKAAASGEANGHAAANGHATNPATRNTAAAAPRREKLPDRREAETHVFRFGGFKGYLQPGFYPDGRLAEVFITGAKEGSTISGLLAWAAKVMSLGLQYGVPLDAMVELLRDMRFEPYGVTGDPDVPIAKSLADYAVRKLQACYPGGRRPGRPQEPAAASEIVLVAAGAENATAGRLDVPAGVAALLASPLAAEPASGRQKYSNGATCGSCGNLMHQQGKNCYRCLNCGMAEGCS